MLHTRITGAIILGLATAALAQGTAAEPSRFTNLSRTFQLDLPSNFRQLAPNEAQNLSDNPATPPDLRSTSPRQYYAVGPVELWLAGDLASPWVYIVEQPKEWHIDGDFAEQLKRRWSESGKSSGLRHEITDVREAEVGPQAHVVHIARRVSTPENGRPVASLDVYAPAGGRQITLSFCAWADDYDRWAPEFDKWIATLTFFRPAKGQQSLSDRLWTPLITGGVVGIILLLLYKHTRRSR